MFLSKRRRDRDSNFHFHAFWAWAKRLDRKLTSFYRSCISWVYLVFTIGRGSYLNWECNALSSKESYFGILWEGLTSFMEYLLKLIQLSNVLLAHFEKKQHWHKIRTLDHGTFSMKHCRRSRLLSWIEKAFLWAVALLAAWELPAKFTQIGHTFGLIHSQSRENCNFWFDPFFRLSLWYRIGRISSDRVLCTVSNTHKTPTTWLLSTNRTKMIEKPPLLGSISLR